MFALALFSACLHACLHSPLAPSQPTALSYFLSSSLSLFLSTLFLYFSFSLSLSLFLSASPSFLFFFGLFIQPISRDGGLFGHCVQGLKRNTPQACECWAVTSSSHKGSLHWASTPQTYCALDMLFMRPFWDLQLKWVVNRVSSYFFF